MKTRTVHTIIKLAQQSQYYDVTSNESYEGPVRFMCTALSRMKNDNIISLKEFTQAYKAINTFIQSYTSKFSTMLNLVRGSFPPAISISIPEQEYHHCINAIYSNWRMRHSTLAKFIAKHNKSNT